MSKANNITAACRNITLYKRSKLWYNLFESEVLCYMYHFSPPQKLKHLYIIINLLLIVTIIIFAILFHSRVEVFGIPIAAWVLFNGLWALNGDWYSWFHKKDKSSYSHGFWLILLITGVVMSILMILIWFLM